MRLEATGLATPSLKETAGASKVKGSSGQKPAIVSRNSARSATLRAIGPCTESWLQRLLTVPRVTRPGEGRRPTTEQWLPGPLSEPPWSVPCASQTSPVATDTAPPPVEPPELSEVFQGLRVRPKTSLNVLPPAPNSGVFDLPITMPPLRSIRSTSGCDFAGTWSANSGDP